MGGWALFYSWTEGTLELRKYINVGRDDGGNRLFLVNGEKEIEIPCEGRVDFPFFGDLILDILNGTENAMSQEHAFKAAELSMLAQQVADLN